MLGKGVLVLACVGMLRAATPQETVVFDEVVPTDAEDTYLVVPYRAGALVGPWFDEGLALDTRLAGGGTYCGNGYWNMAFLGVVRRGEATLLWWRSPDVDVRIEGEVVNDRFRHLRASIFAPPGEIRRVALGPGTYVDLAKAYRRVAKRRGLFVPLGRKPGARALAGAVQVKPFAKVGYAADAAERYGAARGESWVWYTFDDLAALAAHLRELGVERCLFTVAGWMNGGYDIGHPDVLPPAPDCGGGEGLARLAEAVRSCGYIFGLHDNYDLFYISSPSTDPADALVGENGQPIIFNAWAGGPQYHCCPARQMKYLVRNLEQITALCHPDSYFVDQWMALPLHRCWSREHPLDRLGSISCYRRLARRVRRFTGLVGSEDGQEWGVPVFDYFEGLLTTERLPGMRTVPIWELVYRECGIVFTHQGDRASPGTPSKIPPLALVLRTPLYDFAPGREWEAEPPLPGEGLQPLSRGATFEAVEESLGGERLRAIFAHPPWKGVHGGVTEGRFRVRIPEGARLLFACGLREGAESSDGVLFEVRVGGKTLASETVRQQRWRRCEVDLSAFAGREVELALVTAPLGTTVCDWALWGEPRVVAGGRTVLRLIDEMPRAEAGWRLLPDPYSRSEGPRPLGPTDAFVRNTSELLSEPARLTADAEMLSHERLAPGVERTRFSDGTTVTANLGEEEWAGEGMRLPRWGLVIEGPLFLGFYATAYGGVDYPGGALITVRSEDGLPLWRSRRLRVWRAFGSPALVAIPGERGERRLIEAAP